jgi:radical SAM superfamily enzyme YgiQ (UPF0313 family)
MREAAFRMCKIARQYNCKVIVSSSDSTDHFEEYLNEGADFIVLGEGEISLLELLKAVSNEEADCSQIAGLAYRSMDGILKTAKRNIMKNLDELPFPAWDIIDMEPYRKMWLKSSRYFSMNMATTRGCPFKCNWCAKPIYGNRYNSRSPANVVSELKMLKSRFQFDHIWFCDDIFGLKPGWLHEFADLIEREGLKFIFKIQARADLLVQEDYIMDLARAGCDNVWMGAESGSQKILDAMDKGIELAQIRDSTDLLKKYGIKPSFFIQFGYPGETREDIRKTIGMITGLLPHSIGISVSYPLPGTVFYERIKEQLREKTNWRDSDELQLLFRNTYSPAFYKQLHRYTHKEFRKHLALETVKKLILNPGMISIAKLKQIASGIYYAVASFFARLKLEKIELYERD